MENDMARAKQKMGNPMTRKTTFFPWQLDEAGVTSAGDVGGDTQVGEAYEARFVNPDFPRCIVAVTVFVSAPELALWDQPGCTHEEPSGWKCRHGWDDLHKTGYGRCVCWVPPEHLACSHDMDSLGLETYTEYGITREGMPKEESPWDDPEWEERSPYGSLDTAPFNRDVAAANRAAQWWLENFDPAHITWDGEPF